MQFRIQLTIQGLLVLTTISPLVKPPAIKEGYVIGVSNDKFSYFPLSHSYGGSKWKFFKT